MFLSGERKKNRYNRLFSMRFFQCKSLKSLSTTGTPLPMFFPLLHPQRKKNILFYNFLQKHQNSLFSSIKPAVKWKCHANLVEIIWMQSVVLLGCFSGSRFIQFPENIKYTVAVLFVSFSSVMAEHKVHHVLYPAKVLFWKKGGKNGLQTKPSWYGMEKNGIQTKPSQVCPAG